MSYMGFKRTVGTTAIPIWQGRDEDMQLAQGGFQLIVTNLPTDTIIPGGSPVVFDEAARTATFSGGTLLQTAATGNPLTYRVYKNSPIKVGDFVSVLVGGAAYAVTLIDTSNAAYDVLTVGTTLGNSAINTPLFVSSATGANASAFPAGVNGMLYDDYIVKSGYVQSCSVVIRGTVYARRIPFPSAALAALTGLKQIIFSQSK